MGGEAQIYHIIFVHRWERFRNDNMFLNFPAAWPGVGSDCLAEDEGNRLNQFREELTQEDSWEVTLTTCCNLSLN